MNEETEDYLEIASNCIKWAEIQGTMKNYVAGLLKDNDKKDKLLEQKENIIKELEHDFKSYDLEYLRETYQGSLADFIETELKRIQELKMGVNR